MQLRGSTALVTGAGRRMGRTLALSLADAGADVLLHVHTSSGRETFDAVRRRGRRAWLMQADLSQRRDVERLADEAVEKTGGVDVLVHNAAVFFPTPVADLTAADWRRFQDTNVSAPFLLSLLLGRRMAARGHGKIVFLGDWSGRRTSPGYLAYCVSKAGVHALMKALAKALAPHVQVNEVAPGPVLLPDYYDPQRRDDLRRRTPLQRLGSPNDVARAVRFLIEEGDFVTGASYVVDGGWLASPAGGRLTSL